jgi:hypothetical protein
MISTRIIRPTPVENACSFYPKFFTRLDIRIVRLNETTAPF